MKAAATLEVRGITVRFGGVTALDEVSLRAEPGRILGVIGPNGAGKTTLFNVISGVQAATAGSVRFDDALLSGRALHRIAGMGVTRTFQTPVMFWGLTVHESLVVALAAREARTPYPPLSTRGLVASGLGLGARRRADEALRERAREILHGSRLGPLANRPTETLSFGEERLLEMARALALDPKVLLLDEPLSGLDANEAGEVLAEVRAARAKGIAVLLVEHAVGELLSVADRVVVLDRGKKIAEGMCDEVVADPAVVEAYLGDELS